MYHLWEEARMGPLTLKNRTVRSATNEHLAETDGRLTQAWVNSMVQLAQNEVGLIISGQLAVDGNQRADAGQPVLDERTDLALLQAAAEGVHAFGGRMVIQLSHTGQKAPEALNGCPPKSPGGFTLEELDSLVAQFVASAKRCQQAGLDGVQIHCAHGYLLSSFLNPAENLRTDEYGGSLENRFRLIHRILEAVRAACGPDFALLAKIDSDGCGDLHGLLKLLQDADIDGAEVSGLDLLVRAGQKSPFYLDALTAAKEGIQFPLILVGGIFSRAAAEQVLAAGIPFVSFARALICQPDFLVRLKAGTQEESPCLACNGCYRVYRQRHVRCVTHTEPIPQLVKNFGGAS